MDNLQSLLDRAVADGDVPFVVAIVAGSDGDQWSGSAGERTTGEPAGLDTVFRIYSMTKAVAATAAAILVERGAMDLDMPVVEILPAFGDLQVLDGFNGDEPLLRAPKTAATIRHLATHTSGLAYEFLNSDMARFFELTGHLPVASGLNRSLACPLMFDPGTRWEYGIGIDWLGKVIEAIDGRRIDQFCQDEIFTPLGMIDTVFEIDGERAERLADASARTGVDAFKTIRFSPPSNPEFYAMGHALYSTAPDYMRFLRMLLGGGAVDAERILSETSVSEMLANQIGERRVGPIESVNTRMACDVDLFPQIAKTHSLVAIRVEEDVHAMRSAGSQGWAGILNTHYWFDPRRDVAGVLMAQMLPFADPRMMRLYEDFERAVYASLDT